MQKANANGVLWPGSGFNNMLSWILTSMLPVSYLGKVSKQLSSWSSWLAFFLQLLTIAFLEWSWKPTQNQPKITKNRGKHNNQPGKTKTPCNKASIFFFITNLDTTLWEHLRNIGHLKCQKKCSEFFALASLISLNKAHTHTSHISAIHLKGIYHLLYMIHMVWQIFGKRKWLPTKQHTAALFPSWNIYTSTQGSWTNSLAKKPAASAVFPMWVFPKIGVPPKWMVKIMENPY